MFVQLIASFLVVATAHSAPVNCVSALESNLPDPDAVVMDLQQKRILFSLDATNFGGREPSEVGNLLRAGKNAPWQN